LQQLRLAEQQQEWAEAQAILQALGEVYKRWGRKPEFKSLRQRALNQIGFHLAEAKAKGKDAFEFWMHLRVEDANEALQSADLETARAVYQEIIDELVALNDSSVNDNIATYYHNLGVVAQEQRRFDDAIAFYNKALQIREDAGDLYMAAGDYHQLGIVAEEQRRFDDAIAFYNKALKIYEDAEDLYNAAGDYHQLGIVAQLQWQFDDAIAFYNKALKIYEDAGDSHNAANQYEGLGNIAKEQGDFDTAVAYFQKAFTALSAANDWRQASKILAVWGRTFETQSNWTDAVKIYIQALAIDNDHNSEFVGSDIHNLGRMFKQLGDSQFQVIWRDFTGEECPGELFSAIQKASETEEEGAD
jgi:tetratricopeptide (TPR) repeat protein